MCDHIHSFALSEPDPASGPYPIIRYNWKPHNIAPLLSVLRDQDTSAVTTTRNLPRGMFPSGQALGGPFWSGWEEQ